MTAPIARACGLSPCAAEDGHNGTCAEASGWDEVIAIAVQQRRSKGWRKPDNTVSVARPSKWGNPYVIRRRAGGRFAVLSSGGHMLGVFDTEHEARAEAVRLFALYAEPLAETIRAELAGKNLMCFCRLDSPCHRNVLLRIANT